MCNSKVSKIVAEYYTKSNKVMMPGFKETLAVAHLEREIIKWKSDYIVSNTRMAQ